MWVSRTITPTLRDLAKKHPAVAVVGPRQSGKTSLLRRTFPDVRYLALDDPGVQAALADDPRSVLEADARVILDEAQATPNVFPYLKAAIDRDRRPGRFLITGSQNLLVASHVSESLAGRAVYLSLLPFDVFEWFASGVLDGESWTGTCSFPEPFLHTDRQESWLRGYVQTYLHRDVRSVAEVGNLRDFARFLRALALRNGAMLNLSDVARDVSVAPNTIKRWLSILEASFQVFLLEPYLANQTSRLIKRPKLYFVDPWIAWQLADGPPRDPGVVLETSLLAAVYRWAAHSEQYRLYYFRTKEGFEVDLILEPRTRDASPLVAVEIKNTKTYSPSLLRGLRGFTRTVAGDADLILVSNIDDAPPTPGIRLMAPLAFGRWLVADRGQG